MNEFTILPSTPSMMVEADKYNMYVFNNMNNTRTITASTIIDGVDGKIVNSFI